ncbi:MAG TPA: TonB-dependent receptor [Vicinamibacterales bacterium]|jgi:outer membrane receptor protein involved in Fe transport
MKRFEILAASLALLFALTGVALGQSVTATTGAINGKVTDATAGILPGVTVTISSPSMQGVRTAVTNEEGSYRFPAVPPGDYAIKYELGGFSTVVREGIRVGLGFTATVNVELKVASLTETVTVSGQSPVVDVTSTVTATAFDSSRLASLPNARDFWTVLAAAPSIQVARVDVAGSAAGTQTPYFAYDSKSAQHRPMVEGIVNTEGTSAAGYYYDYGSIDEASIGTASHTAEVPTAGVVSQIIAKSGGNTYHGRVYGDYQNESIQARNIDDSRTNLCPGNCGELTPSDLNRLTKYHDLNADIGGFVKKDKLWWYFSTRDQNIQSRLPNFPVKPFETGLRNLSGKVTYSLSTNNKVTAYAQGGRKSQPNRMDTFRVGALVARHASEDSTWRQLYWGHTYKLGWDRVVTDRLFFEMRGGQFKYIWPNYRRTEAPAFQDLSSNVVRGGNRDGWFNIPERNQVLGSASYFKDNWGGSHNFKFGGELLHETFTFIRGKGVDGVVPGDVIHYLNNGTPFEVDLFQTPSESENGLWTFSGYVQDTWRVTDRFTLNLGVRLDRYRTFSPEQVGPPVGRFNATQLTFQAIDNLITWNLPAPRIGLTYDLTGNGKTVLKFNYARYWWNQGTDISQDVNLNPPDWYKRYAWSDLNRNGVWDQGEQGQLNTSRGGAASAVLDPNLKDQVTDEVAAWVEREIVPNVGVHAGYVYRRIDNFNVLFNANRPFDAFNVPITIRDPGPDNVRGTGDDGPDIRAFNLDPARLSLSTLNRRQNLPGTAEFHNIEFVGTKRMTGRWSLQASFAYRWNRDQDTGYFGNNLRTLSIAANPNELINTNGGRYDFTTWSTKVNGTIEAPWALRITPALRYQSGQPFGRTFLATAAFGINYGSQRILAEPISARRQDDITVLDFRAERVLRLPHGRTLSPFVDVYNLGNSDAASNIAWSSGGSFLLPSTIIGPRIMRVGLKFDW